MCDMSPNWRECDDIEDWKLKCALQLVVLGTCTSDVSPLFHFLWVLSHVWKVPYYRRLPTVFIWSLGNRYTSMYDVMHVQRTLYIIITSNGEEKVHVGETWSKLLITSLSHQSSCVHAVSVCDIWNCPGCGRCISARFSRHSRGKILALTVMNVQPTHAVKLQALPALKILQQSKDIVLTVFVTNGGSITEEVCSISH